jgi:hypothetical protein
MEAYETGLVGGLVGGTPVTDLERYRKRLNQLRQERQSYIDHWRDLSDFIMPRRSRLLYTSTAQVNKGWKKNQSIINGKATRASRVLMAGMMAGFTSPARPWFQLTVEDESLNEYRPVRSWLDQVADILRKGFLRSNVYTTLPLSYLDLGVFGTACGILEEDSVTTMRSYSFPIGQYHLANSDRLAVDSVYRELKMTVKQLVERFGYKNCSEQTQKLWDSYNLDSWIDVCHVIEPNQSYAPGRADVAGKRITSCWFEQGMNTPNKQGDLKLLRMGGYEETPFQGPRWLVTGEDVYGNSPGMEALGDIKALQLYEKRKAQLIDKMANPPMRGPSSLANNRYSLLPGDITFVPDGTQQGATFSPAMTVEPQAIQSLELSIREHEQRIDMAFSTDLWLMMAQNEQTMTATEVAERQSEKLIQLAPVAEQLEDGLLDPLVERGLHILRRAGKLPPPPQELRGIEVNIEYTSIMAQALQMVGITGINKLTGYVLGVAAVDPSAMDKLNLDKATEAMGKALGVKAELIRTDDEVKQIRQQRADARAAEAQMQQTVAATQAAKNLATADTSGDNALTRIVGGVAAAQVGGGS